MDCEEARNRLADDLTGSLDEPERDRLRTHLDACAACRAEADALQDVWTKLGAIPAERPDSAAMRARFDSQHARPIGANHDRHGNGRLQCHAPEIVEHVWRQRGARQVRRNVEHHRLMHTCVEVRLIH